MEPLATPALLAIISCISKALVSASTEPPTQAASQTTSAGAHVPPFSISIFQ